MCTGLEKNVDEKTKDLVECLLDSGARVAHGVDVSKRFDEDVGAGLFESNSSNSNKKKKMDRVYFNFPDLRVRSHGVARAYENSQRALVRTPLREKFGTFESERRITRDLF